MGKISAAPAEGVPVSVTPPAITSDLSFGNTTGDSSATTVEDKEECTICFDSFELDFGELKCVRH